ARTAGVTGRRPVERRLVVVQAGIAARHLTGPALANAGVLGAETFDALAVPALGTARGIARLQTKPRHGFIAIAFESQPDAARIVNTLLCTGVGGQGKALPIGRRTLLGNLVGELCALAAILTEGNARGTHAMRAGP